MNIPSPSKSTLREKGAALIVTLLVVVLLATIVSGFIAATRIEQMASRNFTYQNVAEQMALLATEQAIAQLNRDVGGAITTSGSAITMPGATVFNGALVQLSSASAPGATGASTNLNQFGTIHTNTNISFSVPLVAVSNSLRDNNPIFGRFAYWIDDDGSRPNLNLLGSTNTRTNYLPTNSTWRNIFDAGALAGTNGSNLASSISRVLTNTATTNPWPYYFTPRQIYDTNTNSSNCPPGTVPPVSARALIPLVSAGPINLSNAWYFTNTFFRNPRIQLNQDLPDITLPGSVFLARNFLTNAGGGALLDLELDQIITNIDRAAVTNRFGSGFQSKYSRDVLRQIIVNINDLNLPPGSTNAAGQTATTGVEDRNSDGIPNKYAGLRRFIHLNEIAVRAAQTTSSPTGSAVELQIWFAAELVNPYNLPWGEASQIIFKIRDISMDVSFVAGGASTNRLIPFPNWNWSGGTNGAGIETNGINLPRYNVPPFSITSTNSSGRLTYVFQWQVRRGTGALDIPTNALNAVIRSFSITPSVKLLQWTNTPSTIRDWATTSDFGTVSFTNASEIPTISSSIGEFTGPRQPPAGFPSFNTAGAKGIAKNDPRVRTFPGWTTPINSWTSVNGTSLTIGSANSVVRFDAASGISGITPDIAPASTNIFSNPNLTNTFRSTNSVFQTFLSLMELGKVHTGLQWRTLQMRSQSAEESDARRIPDWALLDSFYLSNNVPKINLNSIHYPVIESSSIASMATNGLLRAQALETLLRAGTNSAAATNVFFPSNSAMSSNGTNSPTAIASNISRLGFNTTWANRRAALGATNFPPNAFASTGELLEITNVANFDTSDTVNEGRAASFIDAVSTFSDVFSIYATGYAVDRTGATVSEFTTRTQVQWDHTAQRFRPVFSEPLRAQ